MDELKDNVQELKKLERKHIYSVSEYDGKIRLDMENGSGYTLEINGTVKVTQVCLPDPW